MPFSVSQTVKKVINYRRDGDTLYPEYPKTSGDQVVLNANAQNGVTHTDVQSEIESLNATIAELRQQLTQCVATFAAQSEELTKLSAWATEQGYDPSDYENNS